MSEAFQAKLAAKPETFEGYDPQPGKPAMGAAYQSATLPDHIKALLERKAKMKETLPPEREGQ